MNNQIPEAYIPLYNLIVNAIIPIITTMLILILIMLISTWRIYKKAGQPGWTSIIPIYNMIVLLKIVELPIWYIILFIIPIVNIFVMFKIYIELSHKFGKSTGFGVATIFFGIICLPILAFSKYCVYIGKNTNSMQVNNVNITQNNNMNNNVIIPSQTPAGIEMFNQNLNTNINPINQNIVAPVQQNNINSMNQMNVIPTGTNNIQSISMQQPSIMPMNNTINTVPTQPIIGNIIQNIPTSIESNIAKQSVNFNQTQTSDIPSPMTSHPQVNNMKPINVIPTLGETVKPTINTSPNSINTNNPQI